jgi:thiol-disulfide isomerase/thioredoxin
MPQRPRVAFRFAVLLAALAAAAACTGTNAVSQDVAGSNGYISGDGGLSYAAPGHRTAVGRVDGSLLDGASFDLSSWRGKVVVVNFWGSWCQPCRDEAKALDGVYRQERSHDVEFVGIDVREDRASAEAFLQAHHIGYPSLFDPSSVLALQFPGLPPNATPTTIVLDRDGRIAARQSGEILFTQLRDVVRRVLAEPA